MRRPILAVQMLTGIVLLAAACSGGVESPDAPDRGATAEPFVANLPEGVEALSFDGRELRRVELQHLAGGEILGIEAALPFPVAVAAGSHAELHGRDIVPRAALWVAWSANPLNQTSVPVTGRFRDSPS